MPSKTGSQTMMNTMEINGHQAVIAFDPEIDLFRGEFVGLNGGADFYASDVAGLRREGAVSLTVFLKTCSEKGIDPDTSH
jgi:predicted HicB family RNase H-like nuclease